MRTIGMWDFKAMLTSRFATDEKRCPNETVVERMVVIRSD
ncbi:hypothetical protein UC8_42840 [Roseimaritima ulvae]|uniref:Uncharacterized protein n=1 Tax=Roseimaritima ulvae TaxID=980254 RepID=A0A5B9QWT2_9BACT|nr:hypothetical protein UC8_42840 [Roseimaritima ulvae]